MRRPDVRDGLGGEMSFCLRDLEMRVALRALEPQTLTPPAAPTVLSRAGLALWSRPRPGQAWLGDC